MVAGDMPRALAISPRVIPAMSSSVAFLKSTVCYSVDTLRTVCYTVYTIKMAITVMASVLKEAYFHDETAAFAMLEKIMWPNGKPPHCPHCGVVDRANRLAAQRTKPSRKHPQGRPVLGLWKCYACRKQFTVRKNTVFEDSHIQLHQWFQAAFLMCSSKKGVSANQLHRTLGCTLKTAWFVAHRLRAAMAPAELEIMGGAGAIVEADASYWGPKERNKHASKRNPKNIGGAGKQIVHTLVERGGRARSHHVRSVSGHTPFGPF